MHDAMFNSNWFRRMLQRFHAENFTLAGSEGCWGLHPAVFLNNCQFIITPTFNSPRDRRRVGEQLEEESYVMSQCNNF